MIFSKIYNSSICKWIIEEGEKYIMQNNCSITQTMNNSPIIYLPINKIPNVFRHILSSIPGIFEKMANIYGLENCKLNLLDISSTFVFSQKKTKGLIVNERNEC